MRIVLVLVLVLGTASLSACGGEEKAEVAAAAAPAGSWVPVQSVLRASALEAAGVAAAYEESSLATKLMGTVISVRVREGDVVRAGQVLAEIDSRDLAAKAAQVDASIAEAEAMQREAATHAARMRALYAEDAAPKAQLDAAETGLARADAAVRAARAGARELAAVNAYSLVKAPFNGTVIRRNVDPGAFASPGMPLLTLQDASRLRISVTVAPVTARGLRRGQTVDAAIEGVPAQAVIEGVVPTGGSLYTVNALVENRTGEFLPGSAATLALPQGTRNSIVLPSTALRREGDLTGVLVKTGASSEVRWVRIGRTGADSVEVLAGVRAGEQVLVPAGKVN